MEISAPNKNVVQPGTNAKFVKPNAPAIGWQNVALTSNNSNKCANMF